MLDNLTVLAIIIILSWVIILGFYFYTTRQQEEIQEEIDALRAQLDKEERRQQ